MTEQQTEAAPGEKPTVLVVDDTPENLTVIHGLLRGTYRTRIAANGGAALRIAFEDKAPDLILLDIDMPGIDGYEVCRRLKAEPRTHEVPVVFLTAKTATEDEQLGFDVGAV